MDDKALKDFLADYKILKDKVRRLELRKEAGDSGQRNSMFDDSYSGWEFNDGLLVPRLRDDFYFPPGSNDGWTLAYPNPVTGSAGVRAPAIGEYYVRLSFRYILPPFTPGTELPLGTEPYWAEFNFLDGLSSGFAGAAYCYIDGSGEFAPPYPSPFAPGTVGWNGHYDAIFSVQDGGGDKIVLGGNGGPAFRTIDGDLWTATFTGGAGGYGNLFAAQVG